MDVVPATAGFIAEVELAMLGKPLVRREHGRQPRMVFFTQPHLENVELPIAGEHRIEGTEIAKRLLDHLRLRIDEESLGLRSPINAGGSLIHWGNKRLLSRTIQDG